MAMTERREAAAPSGGSEPRGFRPGSRRRARIAGGAVLAAVAVGGNVLVYSSLDDTTEVVQAVNVVRPGDLVTSEDVQIVEVELDSSVPVVRGEDVGLVVNRYSRTFIAPGTLLIPELVQSTPLVTPGRSVIALEFRATQVPDDVRERSRVELVVVVDDVPAATFEGRVVDLGGAVESVSGDVRLSIEVSAESAAQIVAAAQVEIVLLDPAADADPVFDEGGG